MKSTTKITLLAGIIAGALSFEANAQVLITNTGYTQNFNSIGSGLPTSWTARTGASASSLGSTASFVTAATAWGSTTGQFENVAASTGLTSGASTATQSASTNRAFGLRQSGSFGDPGAAFTFNFATTGYELTGISFDMMTLDLQTRTTTYSIQYSTTGTSWTTLGTYASATTWGSTSFAFTDANFGTALDGQSSAYFRVVALSASSGSGSRDVVAIDNVSFTAIAAVPEPHSLLLLAVGGFGMMVASRRKRSAQ